MNEKEKKRNEDIKFFTLSFGMLVFQVGERFLRETEKTIEAQVIDSKNYRALKKAGVRKDELNRIKKQCVYEILYNESIMGLDDILRDIKSLKFHMEKCTDVQTGIQNLDFKAEDRNEMTCSLFDEIDFYTTALINIYEMRKTMDDATILGTLFNMSNYHAGFVSDVRENLKRQ